jgi:hypothetical protein
MVFLLNFVKDVLAQYISYLYFSMSYDSASNLGFAGVTRLVSHVHEAIIRCVLTHET